VPTNLLLLPLLGGYWFLHTLYYTRFRSQRLDGYRLLLESLIAGVLFAVSGRLAVAILSLVPHVSRFWFAIAPRDVPFLGTACAAFLLGISLPYAMNQICSKVSTR
jgi:hypothetical protein